MVIGFDAKRAFCNGTGLGNYSRMVIAGLAEMHPEMGIRLYTPYRKDTYQAYFDAYPKVKVIEPACKVGSSLWRSWGVSKVIRKNGLDLFHGLSHELPHGLPASLPTVVTMHDMAAWRFPQFFPRWDRMIYQRKQRFACEYADVIIAVSEQTKKDVVEFLGVPEAKVVVVGQSCDPQFWKPVSSEAVEFVKNKYKLPERYVVCVGTVEERKNQLSAVRAMAKVDESISLVIVGRHQPYADLVKAEVEKLHLENRIIFLDHADFADFPALYANAICSLYLSVFEGFGIPVLESMCCGTPVVCSNVSSLPEVGGDAAVLVASDDIDAIAEAINGIAEDLAYRNVLKRKAHDQASRFSKEQVICELYKVYLNVLKTR
jgi:glycosyltransferase involved in cell wall biosynthesis